MQKKVLYLICAILVNLSINVAAKVMEARKIDYSKQGAGIMRNVTDEVFLKTIQENPKDAMCMLPQSVTQEWRVQYAVADDGFKLAADLYYKDKKPKKNRPAIIYVHGGAWVNRGKLSADRQASYFALKENYFTVTMFYRLAHEAQFPAAVHDLKCCIRWVRSIADKYSIDPDKIILMGSSAGTQISLMAGGTNGKKEYEGPDKWYKNYSSDVNLLVLQSPALDLTGIATRPDGGVATYLGGMPDEVPERYKAACPIHYLHKDVPPVFLIQGDKDHLIDGTRPVYEKLQKLGVPSELVVMPGRGHGMFPEDFYPQLEKMRTFIKKFFP